MAPPSSATDSPGQFLFPASLSLLIEDHRLELLFTLRYDAVGSRCFSYDLALIFVSEASEETESSPRERFFRLFVCLFV